MKHKRDIPEKGVLLNYMSPEVDGERMLHKAPAHVLDNLKKASQDSAFNPRGSMQAWEEVIYVTLADGATLTPAAEGIMVPDFTLPANYLYPGRLLKYTLMGRQSSAITTPGTFTLRERWGGLAGTVLAASGAFAPDTVAAATNLTFMVEWWLLCRATGSAGSAVGWGRINWSDHNGASLATLTANIDMDIAPVATPGATTINTTTANALTPTYQPSLATASMTCHVGILEAQT